MRHSYRIGDYTLFDARKMFIKPRMGRHFRVEAVIFNAIFVVGPFVIAKEVCRG